MKQNRRPGKRICSKNAGAPVIQLDPDNNKAYMVPERKVMFRPNPNIEIRNSKQH